VPRWLSHGVMDLGAHPWRSLLSMVSLVVGALALVFVMLLSAVSAEVFVAAEEQRTGRAATYTGVVPEGALDLNQLRAVSATQPWLRQQGLATAVVIQPATLSGIATVEEWNRTGVGERAFLSVIAGDLPAVRRLPMYAGRWLTDGVESPLEVVLNVGSARQFGGIGTELGIVHSSGTHADFVLGRVVGIVADAEADSVVYLNALAYAIHYPDVLAGSGQLFVHGKLNDVASASSVGLTWASIVGISMQHDALQRYDKVDQVRAEVAAQEQLFMVAGLVALVVAALGILNIGLAGVAERRREMVVRRAVGARRIDLLMEQLVAAALVGLIAAGVAIGVALLVVAFWVPTLIPVGSAVEPPGLPWAAAAVGVTAAVVTTLVGALIPATMASTVDVGSALRD